MLALAAGEAAAQSDVGREGGIQRWLDLRNSPFIPIPEVATDPNSGTSFGLLPVYLVTDEQKQITRLYAPDIIYNPALGWGGHFRVFGYPSRDAEWHLVGGAKQKIEREFDALYSSGITRATPWSLQAQLIYDRSATPRFFGIGNDTPLSSRTNYTQEQGYLDATLARNFTRELQASLEMRPRLVDIEPGVLEQSINPALLGNDNDFLIRLALSYDTRDSPSIPTRGTLLTLYGGGSERFFLSSISYAVFGLDARHLLPLSDRIILAGHSALQYVEAPGPIPFWALSSLGGETSVIGGQQPLRGFGEGRFLDKNLFSASLELRIRLFDLNLFSQHVSFEMAPFVDAGRVFPDATDNPLSHLHVAGGIGLRGIARPFIVGHVDIGYANEGVAIFSGIDYPF